MDRLTDPAITNRGNDPWDYCGLDKDCRRDCKGCKLPAQIYRLAMYEDTGFDPAEIEALLEHQGQGQTAPPVRKRQRVEISIGGDCRDINRLLEDGWRVVRVVPIQGYTYGITSGKPYTEYLLEREESDDGH